MYGIYVDLKEFMGFTKVCGRIERNAILKKLAWTKIWNARDQQG